MVRRFTPQRWRRIVGTLGGLFVLTLLLVDYTQASRDTSRASTRVKKANLRGVVTDGQGRPIVGATVYFIESTLVNTEEFTNADVLAGTAADKDEPLEDLINNTTIEPTLPRATTDARGRYRIRGLNREANYFPFVKPAAEDVDHLPGGDASRVAIAPRSFARGGLPIKVAWKFPSDATYIGSTACYTCHGADGPGSDATGCKSHGHALMFKKIGSENLGANQSLEAHASWNQFANYFATGATYNASTSKILYVQDYKQSTRSTAPNYMTPIEYNGAGSYPGGISHGGQGGQAYIINETEDLTLTTYLRLYLWKTTAGVYKITLVNIKTPTDTASPLTLDVALTFGGYIRQRLMVKVPGKNALYPLITYQAFNGASSQGQYVVGHRARRPFLIGGPGGGGLTSFYSSTQSSTSDTPPTFKINTAPTGNNISCGYCHLMPGAYRSYTDPVTGETMAHTVADVNGPYDIDQDGNMDELGVGCEICHGPGSRHREEALAGLANAKQGVARATTPDEHNGKYIINPAYLGNDRASMICGRCHEAGSQKDRNNFPPPGISRAEWVATYATTGGSSVTRYWPDGEHQTSGHEGSNYATWLESMHARNHRRLVACDDCHDVMDYTGYRYSLRGDPDEPDSTLCQRCHAIDVAEHALEKTGDEMQAGGTACRLCHMPRTGRAGAGRPGLLTGTPTGNYLTDKNIAYWENDQSSHRWDRPDKFTIGVAGQTPSYAMPVPYTNSCGTCHDVSGLPYQAPKKK